MTDRPMLELQTATDKLCFDPDSGRLAALHSRYAPGQNMIIAGAESPVFVLQYLDADRRFRQLSSADAAKVDVAHHPNNGSGTASIDVTYRQLAGFNLDVAFTTRFDPDERFSVWSLRVHNDAGLRITDVQFPFIVLPYRLGGTP